MSGRIRTLKPEWLEDELIGSLSDAGRLLSVALILMSDDYGRGRANPALIAATTWAYHPREGLAKVREGLADLSRARFVTLYELDGQAYFEIRGWSKHQRVDKPGKQRIPPSSDASAKIIETLAKVPETLATDLDLRISGSPISGSPTASGDPPAPDGGQAPEAVTERKQSTRGKPEGPSSAERYRDAFCAGIREAAPSERWTEPIASNFGLPFARALTEHGRAPDGQPLRDERLLAWISAVVAEWRRTADARYQRGWSVQKFVEWLNSGRPKAAQPGLQRAPASGRTYEMAEPAYGAPWSEQ